LRSGNAAEAIGAGGSRAARHPPGAEVWADRIHDALPRGNVTHSQLDQDVPRVGVEGDGLHRSVAACHGGVQRVVLVAHLVQRASWA
jgi:hypothetical protein